MSKLYIILIIGVISLSCSSDDPETSDLLSGTWTLISIKKNGIETYSNNCNEDETITFTGSVGTIYSKITPPIDSCSFETLGFSWIESGGLFQVNIYNPGPRLISNIVILNENVFEFVRVKVNNVDLLDDQQLTFRYERR